MKLRNVFSFSIFCMAVVFSESAQALAPFEATINPASFPIPTGVVSFDELPTSTHTPFQIADLAFSGAGQVFTTSFITSPSGSPAYTTMSTPADFVVISLASPARAIGAYFNVQGRFTAGNLEVELYNNDSLLATFALHDLTNDKSSFFGALSNSTPFNRAIFRNVANNRVSFLMDDVTYLLIPEPATVGLLCFGLISFASRRRLGFSRC